MFNESISSTEFCPSYEGWYYGAPSCPQIASTTYNMDVSLQSTLRALLSKRVEENENVFVSYLYANQYNKIHGNAERLLSDGSVATVEEGFRYAVVNRLGTQLPAKGHTVIIGYNLRGGKEEIEKELQYIEEHFESAYPDYKKIKKVTAFFQKTMPVLCFASKEYKSSIIFTEEPMLNHWHYLQCAIPAFMPWYFEENKLTDIEMELLKSLRETDSERYFVAINALAEQVNIRDMRIKDLLKGFETREIQSRLQNLKSNLESVMRDITSYQDSLNSLFKRKMGLEEHIAGIVLSLDDHKDSELMEFFISNKNLCLEEISGDNVYYTVKGYLTYFDEEMAKRYIDNMDSYLYGHSNRIADEDMKMLLEAIFIDQTIKMKLCATYSISSSGGFRGVSGSGYLKKYSTCIPNPHINEYACTGGYASICNQMALAGDYIGVVSQCVASCESINIGEAPTMERLMKQLYGCDNRNINTTCLELPNGEVVNPIAAIKYLKEMKADE